jgi:carboxylesterase type B
MQKGIMELGYRGTDNEMSEDCLDLNVYRPAKSGVYPVMVWIHGGGYTGGAGHGYRGDIRNCGKRTLIGPPADRAVWTRWRR